MTEQKKCRLPYRETLPVTEKMLWKFSINKLCSDLMRTLKGRS
jgi:hypothetical protein